MTKPKAPSDLWGKMDAALRELHSVPPEPRPPGAFTRADFEKRYACTSAQAYRRLQTLQRAGKIKQCGTTGRYCYYFFV